VVVAALEAVASLVVAEAAEAVPSKPTSRSLLFVETLSLYDFGCLFVCRRIYFVQKC